MSKIIVQEAPQYNEILHQILAEIRSARIVVAKQINSTVIQTYWNIGKLLSERQVAEGYGSAVVEKLSTDLKAEFPNMGLSPRNLWDMKRFYERYYLADQKLRQAVAVLPWGHNLLIMNKTNSEEEALYYASQSVEMGWSRKILLNYIKANAFQVQIQLPKSHNFESVLPAILAEQATEMLKSQYNLGFLQIIEPIRELELERRLIGKIKDFILELGKGFSFIGNQYRLSYNNKDYLVDMLFFNRDLKSLVAIELKIGEFKPEYVGKMNFYLTLLDKLERKHDENASIGIILCADKDHLEVEIALQDVHKPIGVAEYQLLIPTKQLETLVLNELERETEQVDTEEDL
jgi:predicted nuclease of restriction endonuclease-like (RecB) superfamily